MIARQEGLPRYIQEALELARLRVKDTDTNGEMTQVLLSACQRYVGQRPSKNQVRAIEYKPEEPVSNYAAAVYQMQMPPPPIFSQPPPQPAQQQQSQNQQGKKKNSTTVEEVRKKRRW
jgi:hypothetical protein